MGPHATPWAAAAHLLENLGQVLSNGQWSSRDGRMAPWTMGTFGIGANLQWILRAMAHTGLHCFHACRAWQTTM